MYESKPFTGSLCYIIHFPKYCEINGLNDRHWHLPSNQAKHCIDSSHSTYGFKNQDDFFVTFHGTRDQRYGMILREEYLKMFFTPDNFFPTISQDLRKNMKKLLDTDATHHVLDIRAHDHSFYGYSLYFGVLISGVLCDVYMGNCEYTDRDKFLDKLKQKSYQYKYDLSKARVCQLGRPKRGLLSLL